MKPINRRLHNVSNCKINQTQNLQIREEKSDTIEGNIKIGWMLKGKRNKKKKQGHGSIPFANKTNILTN